MTDERNQGWLARILDHIPGFRGYGQLQDRKTSDQQTRGWVVDRLQRCKLIIDQHARQLVATSQIDQLPPWEQVRTRIDHLTGRTRSHVEGFAKFFGSAQIDEDRLEDLYDADASLLEDIDLLCARIETLVSNAVSAEIELTDVHAALDEIDQKLQQRQEVIRRLNDQP